MSAWKSWVELILFIGADVWFIIFAFINRRIDAIAFMKRQSRPHATLAAKFN